MLCYFTSLLLMDNHHSPSLLMDVHLVPHVQKIPTGGGAQLCPRATGEETSHWARNSSTELPAAAIKLLLLFFSVAIY